MNVNIVTLDDGKDYVIVDEIIKDNIKYIYLSEENDISNFCIRKLGIINNEEYIVSLDNEEEFKKALELFQEKHKKDE